MEDYKIYRDKGLSGLANVGNSCYINSCMQIMSHTYELNNLLDTVKDKTNKNSDGILLKEWNNLKDMLWLNNCTVAPYRYIKVIQNIAKEKDRLEFIGFDQNDLPEFLLFLVDCFHNGLKRSVDMNISGIAKNTKDELAVECYKMMQNMYSKEYSEILNIFYGISINLIQNIDNNNILSKSCEPYSILTLSIPSKKECTIFDCLDDYTKEEIMDEDNNLWFNDKTNKYEKIKKCIKFWNLPNILIIGLNRFNNFNKKIHTLVTSDLVDIDFSKYVIGYNSNGYIYDLYGIANHSGNVMGGHYTANIKNANGKWYNCNDTIVNEILDNKIITNQAYCLFYRKKNKI